MAAIQAAEAFSLASFDCLVIHDPTVIQRDQLFLEQHWLTSTSKSVQQAMDIALAQRELLRLTFIKPSTFRTNASRRIIRLA
jgi:hypothetical protein